MLIRSKDKQVMKIGINFGALMMTEVRCLELDEIVDDDYCMEKINQALCKYVINSHWDLYEHFDDRTNEIKRLFAQNDQKGKENMQGSEIVGKKEETPQKVQELLAEQLSKKIEVAKESIFNQALEVSN